MRADRHGISCTRTPISTDAGRARMRGLLEGQLAVVTGGGSGIGRAISLGYAKEGARLVVLDVNQETATQTEALINRTGGKAWSYKLDVTDQDACRRVAA